MRAKIPNKTWGLFFQVCFTECYMTATSFAPCYTLVCCVSDLLPASYLRRKCKQLDSGNVLCLIMDSSLFYFHRITEVIYHVIFYHCQLNLFENLFLKCYCSKNQNTKSICSLYFLLFRLPQDLIFCILFLLITVSYCSWLFRLTLSLRNNFRGATWKIKLETVAVTELLVS